MEVGSHHDNLDKNVKISGYYLVLTALHVYMYNWLEIIFPARFLTRLAYLTMLSFFCNLLYYTWMLLVNLNIKQLHNRNLEVKLFRFNFSLSFVVFILYWGVIIANPSLLYKQGHRIPLILDLFLHGANFVLNLAEHFYVSPKYDNDKINFKPILVFLAFYSILLQILFHGYNLSVYPLVESLGLVGYGLIVLIGFCLMVFGDLVYSNFSRKKKTQPKQE